MALYAATKHAVEGYSESLDHELRTWGIRVLVLEPASTSMQIDANAPQADAKLDEYHEARTAVGRRLTEMIESGDSPGVVAEVFRRRNLGDRQHTGLFGVVVLPVALGIGRGDAVEDPTGVVIVAG